MLECPAEIPITCMVTAVLKLHANELDHWRQEPSQKAQYGSRLDPPLACDSVKNVL